jgi:hypothetical protein
VAKLSLVQTDPSLETEGVWVPYAFGMEFRIARMGNPAYEEMLRREREPLLAELRSNPDAPDVNAKLEAVVRKVVAATILKDWRNVDDKDGKPWSYTPEVGAEVFKTPGYEDVYDFIVAQSRDARGYRIYTHEGARKNS